MNKKTSRLICVLVTIALMVVPAFTSMAAGTSFLQNRTVGAASVLDAGNDKEVDTGDTESVREATNVGAGARVSSYGVSFRKTSDDQEEDGETSKLVSRLQEADEFTEELNTADIDTGDEQESESDSEEESSSKGEDDEEESQPVAEIQYPDNLVMANVKDAVNVRKEPSEDSDRVGKLYRDCAGEMIERRDGWTHLKSGKVDGWTKDEYLLFDEEARQTASEVGHLVAKVTGDGLRVRKDATEDAGIWGFVSSGEVLPAIDVVDDVWVSVEYEGEKGFLNAEFATISFVLDDGETLEQIKAREDKEAAEKKKVETEKKERTKNRGAVPVEASDEMLLAALIQCEAGNQPYEGQLAVGAVVMNRVRSGGYPGTVSGVIYASGQFTPAQNGRVASALKNGVKSSCIQAAREAIAGASNVGGATHFRRAGSQPGIVIGAHVFW